MERGSVREKEVDLPVEPSTIQDSAQWSLSLPTLLGPEVNLNTPEGVNAD